MTAQLTPDMNMFPALPPAGPEAVVAEDYNNRLVGLYHATGSCLVGREVVPIRLQDQSVGMVDYGCGSIALLSTAGYEIMTHGPTGAVVSTPPFEPVRLAPDLHRRAFADESDYLHAVAAGLRQRYCGDDTRAFMHDSLGLADSNDVAMWFDVRLHGARLHTASA